MNVQWTQLRALFSASPGDGQAPPGLIKARRLFPWMSATLPCPVDPAVHVTTFSGISEIAFPDLSVKDVDDYGE